MKKFLLLGLLLWVVAHREFAPRGFAQALPSTVSRVNFPGYRDNEIIREIPIAATDALLPISVRATDLTTGDLTKPQPTIVRRGLKLVVTFASSSFLPAQGWVEVKIGGQVRYAGALTVGKNPVNAPPDTWLSEQAYQDLFTQLLLYLYQK